MLRDLKSALRGFRRTPIPVLIAVCVLALGIGANTVVFTLLDAFLLRPLDFSEPATLVRVYGAQEAAGRNRQNVTQAVFFEWRRQATAFSGLAAARNMGLSVTASETPLNPLMREVSSGYFELLGADPASGRLFTAEEYREGGRKVALLSHGFWQSYFGGDPAAVGRTLELAREPYEVVGVMPEGYRNPMVNGDPVLWMPLVAAAQPDTRRTDMRVVGRLPATVDAAVASAELDRITAELAASDPDRFSGHGARVLSLHSALVETVRPALWALFGAVALLLLIACCNVANVLLARAIGRESEMAVRMALGAGRGRIARQLLTEGLLLGLAGAAVGVLVAYWSLPLLLRWAPVNVNVPLLDRVDLHAGVLAAGVAVGLVTSVAFSLLPMLRWMRRGAITGTPRTTESRNSRRWRGALVVGEVALSLALLIGAGLTLRAFVKLASLEVGFDPSGLLAVRTAPRGPGFETPQQQQEFFRRTLEGIEALPGVESAAATQFPPLFTGFGFASPVEVVGDEVVPDLQPRAQTLRTTPGFFGTYGLPVVAGRDFDERDDGEREAVAMLSSRLARQLFGERDPVDRAIVVEGESRRVVGVVADVRGTAQNPTPPLYVFVPFAQEANGRAMTLIARTGGDPLALLAGVERVVWGISRESPVYNATTMQQMLSDVDWQPRFLLRLLGLFAVLALVLAMAGVYAVLATAVAERRRELGVRMAVGARRADVLRLVVVETGRLAVTGVAIGLLVAAVGSRLLAGQLQGVPPLDPLTYLAVSAGMLAVALAAGLPPAMRAMRVDPVTALKSD